MSLNERIREARKRKGITQEQLGILIGVAKTTVAGYENNREPSAAKVGEIADVLGVDVNFLFQDEVKAFHDSHTTPEEFEKLVKPYRNLDDYGRETIDMAIIRETGRVTQAKESSDTIEHLQKRLAIRPIPPHFFAYYGRIAAAGTSVEFSDIAAGVRAYPENELNKNANYVIGVNGDSMEPQYSDGDIVYVKKTDHIETGEIGIFQKGNTIYIKKAGENGLISLNTKYPPLTADDDRIIVLGKVLGKAEEN